MPAPLIFIVDDDANLARLCRVVVSAYGWSARTFLSAKEALAVIESGEHPDALVLDLRMPEMTGRALYKAVRLAGFNNPVVFLSAYGAHEARQELGAEGALAKPFDPEDLTALLEKLIIAPS